MPRVPYHPDYVFSSDEEDEEWEMLERARRQKVQQQQDEEDCCSHASTMSDLIEAGVLHTPPTDKNVNDGVQLSERELQYFRQLYKSSLEDGVKKSSQHIQLPRDHPIFDGSSCNLESFIM